jgi:hypothetical protein
MKELVSNYSHLIDECKQLSLQLNDLTYADLFDSEKICSKNYRRFT